MSAVLYPYVYITARASFIAQSVCVLEVSRTLGPHGGARRSGRSRCRWRGRRSPQASRSR